MFELYQTEAGHWRFHLKNKQEKKFLVSENYASKQAAENGIASIQKNAGSVDNFETKEAKDGRYYFNLKAGNGEIIATSVMYDDQDLVGRCVAYVNRNAPTAETQEI